MTINTINSSVKHAQSIMTSQCMGDNLPFENVLSESHVDKQLSSIEYRHRIFTPAVTLHTLLSQVISADQSCQAAVVSTLAKLAPQGISMSANTAAYCKARARFPESVLSNLTRASAKELKNESPNNWLWRGRQVKLIDGTCVSMPDTQANQAEYPQPSSQKKALAFQ